MNRHDRYVHLYAGASPDNAAPLVGRSVAVVHEWFGATGGSEAVFLNIAELIPHAERFVLGATMTCTDGSATFVDVEDTLRRSKALGPARHAARPGDADEPAFRRRRLSSHASRTRSNGTSAQTPLLELCTFAGAVCLEFGFRWPGSGRLLSAPRRVLQRVDDAVEPACSRVRGQLDGGTRPHPPFLAPRRESSRRPSHGVFRRRPRRSAVAVRDYLLGSAAGSVTRTSM